MSAGLIGDPASVLALAGALRRRSAELDQASTGLHEALAQALREDLRAHARVSAEGGTGHPLRVLVKGSRGSAMDRIVDALLAQGDAADAA